MSLNITNSTPTSSMDAINKDINKRVNLPYSTQDLFPHAPTPSSLRFSIPHGSVTGGGGSLGSYISSSSNFTPSFLSSDDSRLTNKLRNFKKMFKRLFKPTTLDLETAIWEVVHLIINPKKMYRSHYYYKQQTTTGGKFSYTRDDPSFLILLTLFLSVTALGWGLAYSPHIGDIIKLIFYMVFIDFYLTGIVIATVSWAVTNKLFNNTVGLGGPSRHNINYIEWGFCFDIHCNSFLIIWCLLYLVQFLMLPLIRIKGSFFSLLLGNSLYFGSIGYYFVVTFYGFNSLPFISNSAVGMSGNLTSNPAKLLQMIVLGGVLPILGILWVISICVRFNVADTMVEIYFN